MTTFTPPVISPVLQGVVELKLEEVIREKKAFKNRYSSIPAVFDAEPGSLKRVSALLEEIKKLDPYLEDDDDLPILTRYIEQAKDDRSISQAKLLKFEKQLLDKLAVHDHRADVSLLHIELLREAMNAHTSTGSIAAKLEEAGLDDEFELVEGELEDVFERFEKNAFASSQVDVEGLEKYLSGMFQDDEGKIALESLREDIEMYGNDVINGSEEVDEDTVVWCIKHLLENILLSDEKKKVLSGYLTSPAAIQELTATLNMKSIHHWNWRNAEKGLPVTARQNAESKYCITIEEDIMDMLFLHTLAIGWSTKLKEYFTDMTSKSNIWSRNNFPSVDELEKREYYLLSPRMTAKKTPPQATICTMCHGPPAPIPPAPIINPPIINVGPPPPIVCPPPPPPVWNMKPKKKKRRSLPIGPSLGANLNEERYRDYQRVFLLSRLPKREGCVPVITSANETQANLIKYLATESRVRAALDGEVHSLTANIKSFASSLPHETILTLLKFIGVPEIFIEVFTRFLKAPLNMGPLVRGTSDQVLTRSRGVPIAHGMELFFSELVLFFLDFAVHRKTGGYLYRLRDKCYFVGNAEQCRETREQILNFGNLMDLRVAVTDSLGVEPIGFINFGVSGKGSMSFSIDDGKVEAYARRVKKQLAACTTVIDWIRTWNKTVGVYASHLFGPLANVFGKPHVEAVKQAYNRIHAIIFEKSNLTDHIKQLLATHLKQPLRDPPFALDALIFLPTAYGGLGVKNPYIALNLASDVQEEPESEMEAYLEAEKNFYNRAAAIFASQSQEMLEEKLTSIFGNSQDRITSVFGDVGHNTFMTMEAFTRNRESIPYPMLQMVQYPAPIPPWTPIPALINPYNALLEEPINHVDGSEKVIDNVRDLSGRNGMRKFFNLSGEDRWVLQMYSEECFETYGGLEIWHAEGVPLELLRLVRGEDGEVDDDISSVSSMTEV